MYKRFVYYDDCHNEYDECFVNVEKNEGFVKEMENLLNTDGTCVGADIPLFIDNKFVFFNIATVKDYINSRKDILYFIEFNVNSTVFDDVIEFERDDVDKLLAIKNREERFYSEEMCLFGFFMYDNVFQKSKSLQSFE